MNVILLVQPVQTADLCRSFNACFRRNITFCTEMKSRQSVCNIFLEKYILIAMHRRYRLILKVYLRKKNAFLLANTRSIV